MRVDRQHLGIHFAWGIPAACLCLALVTWYAVASWSTGQVLRGGSLPALACGVVAGSIILFEMLLWPRKMLRGRRLIPAKQWMAAHLWFGLASWPLAIVHCGFHLGGELPTVLMILFNVAIFSGIYGWTMQNLIPKLLLKRVVSETIYSQIDIVSKRNFEDARSMLVSYFGTPTSLVNMKVVENDGIKRSKVDEAIVIGAVREVGRIQEPIFQTTTVQATQSDAEKIWHAFSMLQSFLLNGKRSRNAFADDRYASRYFSNLKQACDKTCGPVIDVLEDYCNQRRDFDIQRSLHRWLHSWLPIHIGVSVTVTLLLLLHIITAIRYW